MKKNKAIIFYMLGVITFIGGLLITQPIARAALLVFAAIVAGYQVIAEGIMATIQATRKRRRFRQIFISSWHWLHLAPLRLAVLKRPRC